MVIFIIALVQENIAGESNLSWSYVQETCQEHNDPVQLPLQL